MSVPAKLPDLGKNLRWLSGYGVPLLSQIPDEPTDGMARRWVVDIQIKAKSFERCGRPEWYFESFRNQHVPKPPHWVHRGWRVRCLSGTPEQAAETVAKKVKAIIEGPYGNFVAAAVIDGRKRPEISP